MAQGRKHYRVAQKEIEKQAEVQKQNNFNHYLIGFLLVCLGMLKGFIIGYFVSNKFINKK